MRIAYPVVLLGWAVLHFLWQGAVVGALCAATLRAMHRASPSLRYRCALAFLVACIGLPALTIATSHHTLAVAALGRAAALVAGPDTGPVAVPLTPALDRFAPLLPWLVGVWAAGTAIGAVLTVGGWVRLRRLGRRDEADNEARLLVAALASEIGLPSPPRLKRAPIPSPLIAGRGRGTLILPSAPPPLTTAEWRALLLHELAHVRRHDYVTSLAQRAVECVLWFHPAVWAVSQYARREREQCCDAEAVRRGASASALARALVRLDTMDPRGGHLAVAAAAGPLIDRVRQLHSAARQRQQDTDGRGWLALGAAALAALSALVMVSRAMATATAGSETASRAYAASSWSPATAVTIHATDPAGPFSLRMVHGRVVQATVDGRAVPTAALEQTGDTLRVTCPVTGAQLVVALDPRGAIQWRPRSLRPT